MCTTFPRPGRALPKRKPKPEDRAAGAVLVAQRIAAQPVVAAEQNLIVEVQPPPLRAEKRGEEEPVA